MVVSVRCDSREHLIMFDELTMRSIVSSIHVTQRILFVYLIVILVVFLNRLLIHERDTMNSDVSNTSEMCVLARIIIVNLGHCVCSLYSIPENVVLYGN